MMAPRPLPGGTGLNPRDLIDRRGIGPGGCIPTWPPKPPSSSLLVQRFSDEAVFKHLDKDGDGVLSRGELPDNTLMQSRFAKFDADQDGNIDAKEYSIGRHWERAAEQGSIWFRKLGTQLGATAAKATAWAGVKTAEG